jgi:3-hydroxymyristoyl/3-hydroxydecanoyl-(acyl carrier protein) dehydratase
VTTHSIERWIAADHPAAVGHFPGNPIVPGAVLLDEIIAAIAGGRSVDAIEVSSAKFLEKVRPGERLTIRWHDVPEGEIRFTCSAGSPERRVIAGSLRLSVPR